MKNAYGLSTLMEAIEAANREDNTINEINAGVYESASFLEIGEEFIGSDPVETDMNGDSDYVDKDEEDTINAAIDMIPDDEDDVDDEYLEESVDRALESVTLNF